MRSVVTRVIFLVALVVSVIQTGPELLRHLDWSAYDDFTDEVMEGRTEVSDLAFLTSVLEQQGDMPCDVLLHSPMLTLHLYANELLALRAEVNPFLPSDDPDLSAQRAATRALIEQALVCAPMDGNQWLNLALLSRAMGDHPEATAGFVDLSRQYAPHEGWIHTRREQLF